MGRPKKEQGTAVDAVDENKAKEVAPEVIPMSKRGEREEPPIKLKDCPDSLCGAPAPKGATKDANGDYRCFCPSCKFWDSMVYRTAREAEEGWNAAGGPVRGE